MSFEVINYVRHSRLGILQSFKAKKSAEKIISEQKSKHFIIAGAFSTKRNANKLVRKLKSWDFDNAQIVSRSDSGLYRVSYDGFVTPEDALSALHQIKNTNPAAWLLSL